MQVHINNFAHLGAFTALNYRWIEQLFDIEPSDRKMLDAPGQIIEQGGSIITMSLDGKVVGCCALVKGVPGHFELAKMAVAPDFQGRGLSHTLMRAVIEQAKLLNAQVIDLLTSSKLERAIKLYKAHGFVTLPTACHTDYARCDVVMQLRLDPMNHESDQL